MLQINHAPARRTLLLLAGLVSLSGCATKQDVRDLREDLLAEMQRIAATQDSLRTEILRQSVQTQDTLRSASRELVDIRGDVLTTLNRIGTQLGQIQELVGQNSLNISSLRDQMEAMRRGGVTDAAGAQGASQAGSLQMAPGTSEAENTFNASVRMLQRGSLSAARAGFQQFLERYPSNDLAPAAHFHLAEIMVREEQLDEAVAAFSEIPELYPTWERVPEVLYQIGAIHVELGAEAEARVVLERLVNTYPDHPSAALARELLSDIGDRRL